MKTALKMSRESARIKANDLYDRVRAQRTYARTANDEHTRDYHQRVADELEDRLMEIERAFFLETDRYGCRYLDGYC